MTKKKAGKTAAPESRPARIDDRQMEYLTVGLILLVASALILLNLGNIYLWQDEAQTACIAKTVLTHGVPLGYDGLNYFSQQGGAEYGKGYVWRWHTWLPFYVLAGFFALFGTSTFVCRLPFALAGIGTVLLAYYLGRSLWHRRSAGVWAAALLLVNVPFLLLVRQCRYYSLTALFALGALYAYSEMLKGRRGASAVFVLSFCLLFHTFYVYCPALLVSVVIHSAIYHRDKLKRVLLVSTIAAAINVPWMIYVSSVYGAVHNHRHLIPLLITGFSRQTALQVFTPMLLLSALAAAWAWVRTGRRPVMASEAQRNVVLLVLFIIAVIGVLTFTSPYPFFRYLAPVIPAALLISALILDSTARVSRIFGLGILIGMAFYLRMPDYLYEITHDYNGGIEGIVTYLNKNAGRHDTVAVTHEELPIAFYTGLKVYGPLSGEDYTPANEADWFVIRKWIGSNERNLYSYLRDNASWDEYEAIRIEYPDTWYENREELADHMFRTNQREPDVTIFRRVRK